MEKNANQRLQMRRKNEARQQRNEQINRNVKEVFTDAIRKIHDSDELDDDFKQIYFAHFKSEPNLKDTIMRAADEELSDIQLKSLNPTAFVLGRYILSGTDDVYYINNSLKNKIFENFCPKSKDNEKPYLNYRSVNREDIIRYARLWLSILNK
jgi:hypothetical protein